MADTGITGGAVGCNDGCGCPVPYALVVWLAGLIILTSAACGTKTAGEAGEGHNKCSCGEHCGCNPCTCHRGVVTTGVGKGYCKCGDGCTCATCSS